MVAEGLQRVVADGGVAGDCLHDSYLCRPHVEREVLVVSGRSVRASCSQSADCVSSVSPYLVSRRKTECPRRATQCSTLTITFSLTHLAIRLLPNMIITGPATNQTVKNVRKG